MNPRPQKISPARHAANPAAPSDSLPADLCEPAEPRHVLVGNRFVRVPRTLKLEPLAMARIAAQVEYRAPDGFTTGAD